MFIIYYSQYFGLFFIFFIVITENIYYNKISLIFYVQYVEYIDSNKNRIKHEVKCVDFVPLTICSL